MGRSITRRIDGYNTKKSTDCREKKPEGGSMDEAISETGLDGKRLERVMAEAKKNIDAIDNDGMRPDEAIGERNSDHGRMNLDERRLDEVIGTKSSNKDSMKVDGATYENSSVNGKLVGAMNFYIEKRLYARGSCSCENSGYVKRRADSDNAKRFYIERSGDCRNSGNGKKNFNSMKRLGVRGSYDCKYSGDSDGKRSYVKRRADSDNAKRFYIKRSGDCRNSGNGKKNFNSRKRLGVRGSYDCENSGDKKKNSDSEKKCYIRENCDCERRRNSCKNGCGGEGSSTRALAITTTAEELAAAASDQPMGPDGRVKMGCGNERPSSTTSKMPRTMLGADKGRRLTQQCGSRPQCRHRIPRRLKKLSLLDSYFSLKAEARITAE